jgi:hypothetical protein
MLRALVVALALPGAAPAAPDDCAAGVTALKSWLALAAEDRARGAYLASDLERLVTLPLRPEKGPRMPAMTIVVTKDGLRAGNAPPAPAASARMLIATNDNVSFAKTNPNALARGVLVAAEADARAADVRDVLLAARAEGERAWLVFKPADARVKPPADSPLRKELGAVPHGDVMGVVEVVRREFAACPGLMQMMAKMGGQSTETRLKTIVEAPAPAVEACKCGTPPAHVMAVLWHLALRDLGVLVAVDGASVEKLPFGEGAWSAAAPAVVAALAK